LSAKKFVIFSFVFLILLSGGAFSVLLILENFETLSVEKIQIEKTADYVRLDGLAAPIPLRKNYDYYLYIDINIEAVNDAEVKRVQSELPILHDAALGEPLVSRVLISKLVKVAG